MTNYKTLRLLIAFAASYIGSAFLEASSSGLLILDSIGYNAGEKRYETKLDSPAYQATVGFTGKVLDLFESPLLAVDWKVVDPRILPRFSPAKKWVDKKAAEIDRNCAEAKAAGLKIYAQCDMVLLPKSLVQRYGLKNSLGNPQDINIEAYIRLNIQQALRRFPLIDGYVIRIGETYTQGSPYHDGMLNEPRNIEKTIIPVIKLLVDEICRKGGRTLIVRTWVSFDDPENYKKIDEAIQPHERMFFSVKHCEGDFHRRNPFSRIIGTGKHRQLIEVQCAREYEGKGAYPNYIANGIIEGFEEDIRSLGPTKIRSIRDFQKRSPLFAGVWTWSRGGGWGGPFPRNELWCRLNAWCIAQWAKNPDQSEESIFIRFATEQLGLNAEDGGRLRRLCLLSAEAILRGKLSVATRISPIWTRDDTINTPNLPADAAARARVLDEKRQAVQMWTEIVQLADTIEFRDTEDAIFVRQSSRYGLHLYRIYQAIFELAAMGDQGSPEKISRWLEDYDSGWADLRSLCAGKDSPATIYQEKGSPYYATGEAVDMFIAKMRLAAKARPTR